MAEALALRGVTVRAQGRPILDAVDLNLPARGVTGLIGPSGAGKTTLLRCLNRLTDLVPGLEVRGSIRLGELEVLDRRQDLDALRARVGMLFQEPVTFPGSIFDNVVFGLKRLRRLERAELAERAERALGQAALWHEVRDRLRAPAATLSTGQRQRLALARCLALEPEVLLLDEPTSALDPRSTEAIEELLLALAPRLTLVLVTHDLAQARRVTDRLALLMPDPERGARVAAVTTYDALLAHPPGRDAERFLGVGPT
jgi:phosphate transport system ATP-binding protein